MTMHATLVKICGLRDPADALVAAEAGADLIGVVFAPSQRAVSLDTAGEIAAAVRAVPRPPRILGLFVNEEPERVAQIGETLDLDAVQLCGDEAPEDIAHAGRPALKALRLNPEMTLDDARRLADDYLAAPVPPLALVVDSHVPGAYGGTGVVGDWALAARLAEEYPVVLAGGLTPDNVAKAIAAVRPLGVDVSSGVETDGVKDQEKIRAFAVAARTTGEACGPAPVHFPDAYARLARTPVRLVAYTGTRGGDVRSQHDDDES